MFVYRVNDNKELKSWINADTNADTNVIIQIAGNIDHKLLYKSFKTDFAYPHLKWDFLGKRKSNIIWYHKVFPEVEFY